MRFTGIDADAIHARRGISPSRLAPESPARVRGRLARLLVACAAAGLVACAASDVAPERQGARTTDIFLPADTMLVRGEVPTNATLDAMLRTQGLAGDVVKHVVDAAGAVFDLRRLRAAQPYSLERSLQGALRFFEYEIDADRLLRIAPEGVSGVLRAEVLPIPKTLALETAAGRIDRDTPSLFQAMAETGEGAELAVALAGIFAGEVDFNSDIQPEDGFALSFEKYTRERGPASYGHILAAEFQNGGRTLRAFRFTPPGGEAGYYDEQGRSLRRFFLRSPLKFEPRITSRFSLRRLHPVLHTTRAHNGVDYAAPTGAPVLAIASGTVISATFDRTNGRMVRIRHTGGYESLYLHLSAFAQGLRAGMRINQGEVLGRVGSTGLATGPHLHYALKKNGAFVNPLAEHQKMPSGEPVPPALMQAFLQERDQALETLRGPALRLAE
ncbi:MAG: M23 family metallopeptidase [Acidobacteria bacterium]|nr:M23 family metallopeptidase [Acidobacteriota bacterium]